MEQPGHESQTAESRDNSRINCCFSNTHLYNPLDLKGIMELATKRSRLGKEREASKGFRPARSIVPSHTSDKDVSTRTKAGSKQNPQLPPFSWILMKCECANIELKPIPPQKPKKVLSLVSMETQPGPCIAEGSTSHHGQTSPM